MSDFEHDDELRDALRRAHPARREAGPTLTSNRPRMVRARARRRAAIGSITAASVLVVGAAIFASDGTNDTNVVDVVAPPNTAPLVPSTAPGDPLGSTTTVVAPSTSMTTRIGPDQSTTAPAAPPPTSESTTSRPPSTTTTTTTTTAGPARKTHTTSGGTVTVTWTTSAITIEQITDALGWTHTVEKDESDDIEIRWRRSNPEDDTKVRLRLIDGAIREEIE